MQLEDAIDLIKNERFLLPDQQVWADLGSGTGTFTLALAHLLPSASQVYAVDQDTVALRKIPERSGQTIIEKIAGDFTQQVLPFTNLDGILMANSLHYVKDKLALIHKLRKYLREDGCFIIVEYDTDMSNPWVPYPITFTLLKELFTQAGYHSIIKLQERVSVYRQGKIYAALIQ